ncbi:RidA family protein [Microvirga lotononidis]|uniref:Putative translation initiation inhibitor, yjgF family n=1 Tax=Microvirga lotononidis TaxID=864069 RepID=I4Z4C0_9HYPH|nr:RidA family protein [Microvirga lotononidis]EIM31062.1 putative translation initiation inhibitor, yjgF family [Microvirga lotononidis]WQO30533.1 RidA family protein [Microvirga lotononidis]
MATIAARLRELGIALPSLTAPSGTYVPYRISGSTIYISGQVPRVEGVDRYLGVVGETMQVDEAYQAARVCALNVLARLSAALDGDLDRVSACLQVRGFVNATPTFKDHPAVIDGASDLFVEIFGEKGRHSRTALGAGSLPRGFAVEVDAIFEAKS